jgi:hypothetical protein
MTVKLFHLELISPCYKDFWFDKDLNIWSSLVTVKPIKLYDQEKFAVDKFPDSLAYLREYVVQLDIFKKFLYDNANDNENQKPKYFVSIVEEKKVSTLGPIYNSLTDAKSDAEVLAKKYSGKKVCIFQFVATVVEQLTWDNDY